VTISLSRLEHVLTSLPNLTIGLLGDLFLDRYLELAPDVHETSLETGLEAYQVTRVRNCPGALGTVMNNLAALGVGRLLPVTVLGDDGHGFDLRQQLEQLPVDLAAVLRDSERLTPTYTKPLRRSREGQWEELNRLDVRTREPLSTSTGDRVCDALHRVWRAADGLIVMDQVHELNCGVVSDQVRDFLATLAEGDSDKVLFVDSRAQLSKYTCGVLKGNRREILEAAGTRADSDKEVRAAARSLTQRTGRPVFCTMGEQGILVAEGDAQPQLVPGCAVEGPIDIVGAGDAATSGIVTSLVCGATAREAAAVGNLVASITVQQLGTTGTASPEQVLERRRQGNGDKGMKAKE
jgi:rfaE bifunctional protein kinase chain/domain